MKVDCFKRRFLKTKQRNESRLTYHQILTCNTRIPVKIFGRSVSFWHEFETIFLAIVPKHFQRTFSIISHKFFVNYLSISFRWTNDTMRDTKLLDCPVQIDQNCNRTSAKKCSANDTQLYKLISTVGVRWFCSLIKSF